MAQPNPIWGNQLNYQVLSAKSAIWCVNVTNADRVRNQIIAIEYMCIDRDNEIWFVLMLRRHHMNPAQYMLYVFVPGFAPLTFQRFICNVRSWSNQQEYVRRSERPQPTYGAHELFVDLVFDEDEHPNVNRLVIEITVLSDNNLIPGQQLWPFSCVRYPAALLTPQHLIPGLQPAVIPAAPIPAAGAAPPQHQHIPEVTNNNILTLTNLSDPAQNPALAQAAHNPQAVQAALSYGDPLRVETRRSQRLATRNGGSYTLFGKLP